MPGFDGTGPMGLGAMTGRGMGYCAVKLSPSSSEPGPAVDLGSARLIPGSTYRGRGSLVGGLSMPPILSRPVRPGIGRARGFRHGTAHNRRPFVFGW
jgi:hypothetical protein